jgi:colanic acid biosynthesis glycosyl transferase WcaI
MDTQKSVLIIGINFFPEPTGIGKYTGEFAFHLAQNGYKTKVLTGFPYYPHWKLAKGYHNLFYSREIINNVSVTRCPLYIPGKLGGLRRMMQDLTFFLSALIALTGRVLIGKKYDMVFIPSPSFMSGFLGVYYRFFYRKSKIVYHIQDLQVDAAQELNMIKSKKLLEILKKAEGFILSRVDWVTTISTGMLSKILAKPHKVRQYALFPNWVDFDKVYPKEPNLEKLSCLGFPLDKKLVFYSGAVGEKQGLEMVLDAASKALVNLPELVFVIAGSGPFANILSKKAAEKKLSNVFFIDLQPSDIFNELLNHAFLHLVIQKDKAANLLLPSKLTNILAVGGLCIVTASPNTTLYEIVAGNNVGVVVPPENAEAFWSALVTISTDSRTVDTLKESAALFAKRNLEKESIIANFLADTGMIFQAERVVANAVS